MYKNSVLGRPQKIVSGGKLFGKSRRWAVRFDSHLSWRTKDAFVPDLSLNTAYIFEAFKKIKKGIGVKILEETIPPIIAATNLEQVVHSKKIQDESRRELKRLYNDAVAKKFSNRGSGVMRWLPLSKATLADRKSQVKRMNRVGNGKNVASYTTKPLFFTSRLRDAVVGNFHITDYGLFNRTAIRGDRIVFKNIKIDVDYKDNKRLGHNSYYRHSSFSTFKELMAHQSRWRQIPLTRGVRGEDYGTRPGGWASGTDRIGAERETLKSTDFRKGEFYAYVWRPFSKFWINRITKEAMAAYRYDARSILKYSLKVNKDNYVIDRELFGKKAGVTVMRKAIKQAYGFRWVDVREFSKSQVSVLFNAIK